jgi:branched-chain amino acid transport system permease protein
VTAAVLVDGVFLGAILCLASLGLSLTYAVFRFPNFAHGDLITVAGYGAWAGASAGGVWVGVVAAVLAAMTAAVLADRLALRGLLARGDAAAAIIGSFAIGLILRNLVVLLFGSDATESLMPLEIATPIWHSPRFSEARLTSTEEAAIVGTMLLIVLGHLLLRRTEFGRELRAVAESPELAGVCGIVVPRVRLLAWCLTAGSCAAAGVALIMLGPVNPETGAEFMLPALAAVIAGGLGSIGGTLAGAVLIGMAESVSVHFNLAEWRQVISFLIIIVVLCIRPAGFAGRRA